MIGNRTERASLIPSFSESIFNTFTIIEKTVLRQKTAVRAPDIDVSPEILRIQMLEFYKADEIFRQAQSAKEKLGRELGERLGKSRGQSS